MGENVKISKNIVSSIKFLKMPISTQALYFHLCLAAFEDGMCEAFPVKRMTGAADDDLKILEDKGYIEIMNDDLSCFITDWKEHNGEN